MISIDHTWSKPPIPPGRAHNDLIRAPTNLHDRQMSMPGPKRTADTEIGRPSQRYQGRALSRTSQPRAHTREAAANKKLHQLLSQLQKPAIEEYPGTNILSDTDRTRNTNPIRSPKKRRTKQHSVVTLSINQPAPLWEAHQQTRGSRATPSAPS